MSRGGKRPNAGRPKGVTRKAVDRYIELNPDKGDIAMTMMQHLEERITKKVLDQYAPKLIEQGIEQVAQSMLKKGLEPSLVSETTGLSSEIVFKLKKETH